MVSQTQEFGKAIRPPFVDLVTNTVPRLSKGGLSSGYSSIKNVITIVAFIFGVLVFVIHNKLVLALSIH